MNVAIPTVQVIRGGAARALALAAALSALAAAGAQTPLKASDFRQIGAQGMGDKHNSYAWAINEFKGKVYFGSNRDQLCFIQDLLGTDLFASVPELPLECPAELIYNDNRARLFEYDPKDNTVRLVLLSPNIPTLQSDGSVVDVARESGWRAAKTFREADGTEAMYVFGFDSRQLSQPPARIMRTTDGRHYTEIKTPFSDNPGVTAFRSAFVYKDQLWVCVIGAAAKDSVLLTAKYPERGEWFVANEPFFGDPTNDAPYRLATFKGYLYVGMANSLTGYQLLRTDASGQAPYHFDTVLKFGAYRGQLNENVVSLKPYGEYLYVGSGILFGGYDVIRDVGPAPAEMVRVDAQGKWDLICGVARDTPDGYKAPLSGKGPGFGNPFTGYMWRMKEHEGVFYLGTFDSSYIFEFIDGVPTSSLLAFTQSLGVDRDRFSYLAPPVDPNAPLDEFFDLLSAREGGFDLYSTTDGITWDLISQTGFSDKFNYGIRNFESTNHGLYLGANNPFFGFQIYLGQYPDRDIDGDAIKDKNDNCLFAWNPSQSDIDGDGIGDACDNDNDGDCIIVVVDSIPGSASQDMSDVDGDGIPDRCDLDNDNDGYPDTQDNCDFSPNPAQFDTDGDGLGDECDPDDSAFNSVGTDGTISSGPAIGGMLSDTLAETSGATLDGGAGTGSSASGGSQSSGASGGSAVSGSTATNNGSGGGDGSAPPLCGLGFFFGLPLMLVGLRALRVRR